MNDRRRLNVVNVTMLLADSAQVADGKLFILGGGWSITGPDPAPQAVALKFQVDSHEFNATHHWEIFLTDADGRPVMVPTEEGDQPVEVRGEFRVGDPTDVPPGTPVDIPIAVNFGPIPLSASSRYTWRVSVDGDYLPGGTVSFSTRPARES